MTREAHPFQALTVARADALASAWLAKQVATLDEQTIAGAYAGAGRRFGFEPVVLSADEALALEQQGILAPAGWPLSAVARALLLVRLCDSAPHDSHPGLIERVFRTGDNAEREALLHALGLLKAPERFVGLAIDACRSHVQGVFEAIACENPYPAAHFPEESFNQMVLKAFFTEVQVRRIEGLASRRTPELKRMAEAYASERRAAGRSVPPDLHLATGLAHAATP